MSSTNRHGGQRTRVALALIAGLALVWVVRLVSAWADHTVVFLTFTVVAAALVLLVDWLIVSFGPGSWHFVRSVATSLGRALREDAEVTALVGRHPGLFGFLGRRFSREHPSGLYLTVTAACALYFSSNFVSVALSLALSRAITDYDPQISALTRAFRTPTVTRVLWGATVLADLRVLLLLALVGALLLMMWGRRAEAGLLVVTLSGGLLLQGVTKQAFHRPRPPVAFSLIKEPSSFSFPSGHALMSLLFAGVIVFVLWRALPSLRARLATLFVAALFTSSVGFSRAYLGVHWASDVIASWSLALAWLSVTCGCYLMLARYRGMRAAWPAWSSRQVRMVTTLVASLLALVVVIAGAQTDPLLAQATAATPSRPWIVTINAAGLPSPTPSELQQLPLFSEKLDGSRQEPIGMVFIGTRAQLASAFAAAGWQTADPPSPGSMMRAILAALTNHPDPTAPVTPAFLDGTVQDIAFEKPEGAATVRRRHHARFWMTSATLGGVPVWVATASFDSRLEIGTTIPLPTHHVEPDIDAEQAYVVADLVGTGNAALVARVRVTQPSTGTNAAGDAWFTRGYASILEAKP